MPQPKKTSGLMVPREQCASCAKLALDSLINAPSISLRYNFAGLPPEEHRAALLSTLPLILLVAQLKVTSNTCSTCNLLRIAIKDKIPPDCEFITIYQCKGLDDTLESIWIHQEFTDKCVARVKCFADEGSPASRLIQHRPVPLSASAASIKGIRAWLKTCDGRHPQCNFTIAGDKVDRLPILPTRVIDLQEWPTSVRLMTTSGQRAKYVALSHCWGGISQIRTTKTTLREYHKRINLQALPQTLQDAIYITQALKVRYIWIDSLCIIQEDPDDFDKESRKMASVYQNTYFTIAATAATDGTKGLFQVREPHGHVKTLCDFQKPQAGFMYFSIWNEDEENAISDAPLNQRGWVLQERLFSRRILHFARDQVYWECDKLFVGQDRSDHRGIMDLKCPTRSLLCCVFDDFRGFRRNPHHVNDDPFNKYSDLHSMWAMIVKTYSHCRLSDGSDKLPAGLSLILELEAIFGHPFHQGHWFDGTPFTLTGLLWRGLEDTVLTRPLPLRASTWSWASTEGPIEFADEGKPWFVDIWHPMGTDSEILGVTNHCPAGGSSCKALMLSAVAVECHVLKPCVEKALRDSSVCNTCLQQDLSNKYQRLLYTLEGELVEGEFEYDTADDRPCKVWLIGLYVRWKSREASSPVYYVLLVSEVVGQQSRNRVFRRVGMGFANDIKWFTIKQKGFLALV